jgi:transcriptional regulator with XRE-family HTH domain
VLYTLRFALYRQSDVMVQWHEGDVIRKLRKLVGWTLEDLSKASGVDTQVIHRLEIGKTKEAKRATLSRLAGAFGLTSTQLLSAVPTPIDLPVVVKVPAGAPPKKERAVPAVRKRASS